MHKWKNFTLSRQVICLQWQRVKAVLVWNEEKINFQSRNHDFFRSAKGIQVSLKDKFKTDANSFSCRISLQGSRGMFFAPMGRNTTATIASNWPDPSFQGNWLPTEQTITGNGFQASWSIGSLGPEPT